MSAERCARPAALATVRRTGRRTLPLVALLVALAACSADGALGPGGAAPPPSGRAAHPGFDVGTYPGDALMSAWADGGSPYEWVGYYLVAPCHRDASWSGRRAALERLGWGTAVVYVGQQTWDGVASLEPAEPALAVPGFSPSPAPGGVSLGSGAPAAAALLAASATCSRTLLAGPQGASEGNDAVVRTRAEGFPPGTTIYLDLEHMDAIPTAMESYYRAWTGAVLAEGTYRPGVYVHRANVAAVRAALLDVYAAARAAGAPRFWIAGGSGFTLDRLPSDVGVAYADAWQGALDAGRSWAGLALSVDESVATLPSPSR